MPTNRIVRHFVHFFLCFIIEKDTHAHGTRAHEEEEGREKKGERETSLNLARIRIFFFILSLPVLIRSHHAGRKEERACISTTDVSSFLISSLLPRDDGFFFFSEREREREREERRARERKEREREREREREDASNAREERGE